jgi:4-hydroxybenzoate polyprenyltransferase
MEETNRIVINFTVENWMIYLVVIAIAFSLVDSTLNIIKWYYQRKIDKTNKTK